MKTAVDILSIRPKDAIKGKEYNDWDWLHRAFRVMERFPITKEMENNSMFLHFHCYHHLLTPLLH